MDHANNRLNEVIDAAPFPGSNADSAAKMSNEAATKMFQDYYAGDKSRLSPTSNFMFDQCDIDKSGGLSKQETRACAEQFKDEPDRSTALKVLLSNFDIVSHLAGTNMSSPLDLTPSAYAKDLVNKPEALRDEITAKDMYVLANSSGWGKEANEDSNNWLYPKPTSWAGELLDTASGPHSYAFRVEMEKQIDQHGKMLDTWQSRAADDPAK